MVDTPSYVDEYITNFTGGFQNLPFLNSAGVVQSWNPGTILYKTFQNQTWVGANGLPLSDSELSIFTFWYLTDLFYLKFCQDDKLVQPPPDIGRQFGGWNFQDGTPIVGVA